MANSSHYDAAVIGLGLIGAGALRHLSLLDPAASVGGIGPGEPDDFARHDGVFAEHYDAGRITRRLDRRYEWALLASRAIDQYASIEATSGIAFHRPVGLVIAERDQARIAQLVEVAARLDIEYRVGSTETSPTPDPRLCFGDGSTLLHEPGPAGHIDPRRMIRAQLRCAELNGARIERQQARSIAPESDGGWRVDLANGDHLVADRVIVAAGPHSDEISGLPRRPNLRVHAETVVMAHVGPDEQRRLAGLPSGMSRIDHANYSGFYFVPPTDYPDGSVRLKLGATSTRPTWLNTASARRTWMRGDDHAAELPALRALVEGVVPGITVDRWETKPCMITETATGLPYLEHLADGLVIAAGGNGYAAKSADAIGALAAGLLTTGQWLDPDLAEADFRM